MYCLSQFCYCCLKKRKQYIDINYHDIDDVSYLEKFRFCYLRIDISDEIPKVLCLKCCKALDDAYTFRKIYLQRREKLKGYVVMLKQMNNDFTNSLSSLSVNLLNADEFLFKKEEEVEVFPNISEDSIEIKSETEEIITIEDVQETEVFDIDVQTVDFTLNNPFVLQKEESNQSMRDQTDDSLNNYEIVIKEKEEEEAGKENGDLLRVVRKDEDSGLKIVIRKSSRENDFKCSSCDEIFSSVTELNNHSLTHETKPSYNCMFCSDSFPNERFLLKHERNHPSKPDKPYKCKVCQKDLKHKITYRFHMSIHTGDYIYKCNICKKGLSSKQNLAKHKLTHLKAKNKQHDDHSYVATTNHDDNSSNHDDNTSNHVDNSSNHGDTNTNKPPTPNKSAVNLTNVQCEAVITHNLDEYKKTLSMINNMTRRLGRPKKFRTPRNPQKSPKNPPGNTANPKRKRGRPAIIRHCKICDLNFANRQLYNRHVSKCHTNVECQLCHRKFKNTQLLLFHKKYCDASKFDSFKCKICHKGFRFNIQLKHHLKTHEIDEVTDIKNGGHFLAYTPKATYNNSIFSCQYCYKSFKFQTNLNKHKIIYHADEVVRHQCNFCEKSFLKRSLLLKHQKKHIASEKRYKCSECPRDYKSKNILIRHLLTHSNEMAYQCTSCNRRFNLASSLEKHQNSKFCKKPVNISF